MRKTLDNTLSALIDEEYRLNSGRDKKRKLVYKYIISN